MQISLNQKVPELSSKIISQLFLQNKTMRHIFSQQFDFFNSASLMSKIIFKFWSFFFTYI